MSVPSARLLATLALLASSSAWAGHPLASETADALEKGACEAEFANALESTTGNPASRQIGTVLGCGIGWNTQAAVALTRERAGAERADSFGLIGKSLLWEGSGLTPSMALRYGAHWARLPGEGGKLEEVEVVAVASWALPRGALLHANVGWVREHADKRQLARWSLGVETSGPLVVAADVFGDDRSDPWGSVGLGFHLGSGAQVSVSYAVQLDRPRVRALTLGAKFSF